MPCVPSRPPQSLVRLLIWLGLLHPQHPRAVPSASRVEEATGSGVQDIWEARDGGAPQGGQVAPGEPTGPIPGPVGPERFRGILGAPSDAAWAKVTLDVGILPGDRTGGHLHYLPNPAHAPAWGGFSLGAWLHLFMDETMSPQDIPLLARSCNDRICVNPGHFVLREPRKLEGVSLPRDPASRPVARVVPNPGSLGPGEFPTQGGMVRIPGLWTGNLARPFPTWKDSKASRNLCTSGKVTYHSLEQARRGLPFLMSLVPLEQRARVGAYNCPHCHLWHLTSHAHI